MTRARRGDRASRTRGRRQDVARLRGGRGRPDAARSPRAPTTRDSAARRLRRLASWLDTDARADCQRAAATNAVRAAAGSDHTSFATSPTGPTLRIGTDPDDIVAAPLAAASDEERELGRAYWRPGGVASRARADAAAARQPRARPHARRAGGCVPRGLGRPRNRPAILRRRRRSPVRRSRTAKFSRSGSRRLLPDCFVVLAVRRRPDHSLALRAVVEASARPSPTTWCSRRTPTTPSRFFREMTGRPIHCSRPAQVDGRL